MENAHLRTAVMGIPALPEWADEGIAMLRARGAVTPLFGFHCNPMLVSIKREELLAWIGGKVAAKVLPFPESNRAVLWPAYSMTDLLPSCQQSPP